MPAPWFAGGPGSDSRSRMRSVIALYLYREDSFSDVDALALAACVVRYAQQKPPYPPHTLQCVKDKRHATRRIGSHSDLRRAFRPSVASCAAPDIFRAASGVVSPLLKSRRGKDARPRAKDQTIYTRPRLRNTLRNNARLYFCDRR